MQWLDPFDEELYNKMDHKEYFAWICFPANMIKALFSKLPDKIVQEGRSLIIKEFKNFFLGLVTVS